MATGSVTFNSTSNNNWTPDFALTVEVQAWGAGGGGAGANNNNEGAAGGGGGAYASSNVSVAAGTIYSFAIGGGGAGGGNNANGTAGNNTNFNNNAVKAAGGAGGTRGGGAAGAGGTQANSTGTTTWAGGAGFSPANATHPGGGGGAGAQNSANGATATAQAGATGANGGGTGGNGGNNNTSGNTGGLPGGGGGGAGNRTSGTISGAAGANGQIIISWTIGAPTLTTSAPSALLATTCTGNGNITSTGGAECTQEGFVWGLGSVGTTPGNVAPGSSGYAYTTDNTGSFTTGAYTCSITGLTANTTYYYRAYAYNGTDYSYGNEVSFTTPAWSWLQGNNGGSTGVLSSCSFVTQNCAVGSLLTCWFEGTYVGGSTPTGDITVSDPANGHWILAFSQWQEVYATNNYWAYIACFYVVNTSATKPTVTPSNLGFVASATVMYLDEYSGESGSGSFVDGSGAILWSNPSGTGQQSINSASVTTLQNGDLISSFFYDTDYDALYVSALAAGTGCTLAQANASNPGGTSGTEYEILTSAGTIQPTWAPTFSGTTNDWVAGATVAFRLTGAGGGNIWNMSCTEGLAGAEAISAACSFGCNCTDGMAGAEALSPACLFSVSGADGLGLSELAAAVAAFVGSVSEGLATSDSASGPVAFAGGVSEGLAASDSMSVQCAFSAASQDGLLFSDAVSAAVQFLVTVPDGISLADLVGTGSVYSLTATDGTALGDTAGGQMAFGPSISEGLALGDTAGGQAAYSPSASEGMALGDMAGGPVAFGPSVSEGMALSDSVSGKAVYATSIIDGLSLAEAILVACVFAVGVPDGISLADLASCGAQIFGLTAAEGLAMSDSLSAALNMVASVLDAAALSESVSTAVTFRVNVSDGMQLGEALSAIMQFAATITDGFALGDLVIRQSPLRAPCITFTVNGRQFTFIVNLAAFSFAAAAMKTSSFTVNEGVFSFAASHRQFSFTVN